MRIGRIEQLVNLAVDNLWSDRKEKAVVTMYGWDLAKKKSDFVENYYKMQQPKKL